VKYGTIIISRNNVEIIKLQALQTQTLKERLGGLLLLKQLQTNQALWIAPCNSIHTFGMKYALDLIYFDKDNKVCGLVNHIKPWRINVCLKASVTVELVADSIKHIDIRLGDTSVWQD